MALSRIMLRIYIYIYTCIYIHTYIATITNEQFLIIFNSWVYRFYTTSTEKGRME